MSSSKSVYGFDIVQRHDGSYAVYDYAWWPDEYLDADPGANQRWLAGTQGWRAKGWQVVHVDKSYRAAHDWAYRNRRAG